MMSIGDGGDDYADIVHDYADSAVCPCDCKEKVSMISFLILFSSIDLDITYIADDGGSSLDDFIQYVRNKTRWEKVLSQSLSLRKCEI